MSTMGKNIDLMKNMEEKYHILTQIANAKKHKKVVVDAGLLKAGKSSLFNALAGKNVFATDVVRATVENEKVELNDYVLLDTPGLDARDDDTNIALAGYETADVILFVHNLQEGEFSQTEVDSIRQIADMFGDWDMFFKNVILALTHKDQVEDHYEAICKQIDEQCNKVFHNQFAQTFCVDSVGYMKGLEENKKLLMQDSGILELHKAMIHCVNDEHDLQRSRFEKQKKEYLVDIDKAIVNLRAEMPAEVSDKTAKLRQAKVEMQKIAEASVNTVSGMTVRLSSWKDSKFTHLGKRKDYREYSSESSARSAGISAIESMIHKAKSTLRSAGMDIVEEAESYISANGKPTEIRNIFSDTYEQIRNLAKLQNVLIKTNFDLTVKSFSTSQSDSGLSRARDEARYDPLCSANHYASSYSCNLDIDYDYKTVWERGFLGREREREVTVYKYDAEGAMDDVSSDMVEHLSEVRSKAQSAVSEAFKLAKQEMCAQFNVLVQKLMKEMDIAISQEEEKQKTANATLKQVKESISKLESRKREIEAL